MAVLVPASSRAQGVSGEPFPSPTQAPPTAHYVGSAACSKCHVREASQQSTPMARALELAAECDILRLHPRLTFRTGPYTYEIVRKGNASTYTVSDGHDTISESILWAFGLGEAGQTYVFKHDGSYYESRVSFFNDIQGLDFTLGAAPSVPTTLGEAAGRPMSSSDARTCFGCHSTGAVSPSGLDVGHLVAGVSCESCHGAGAQHLAALESGKPDPPHIFNPGRLNTGDLADFCGACHRTSMQVELMHVKSIQNVRFQPYRLTLSKCFDQNDPRISCVACHDPHQNVSREPASYDTRCLACHSASRKKPATAHLARSDASTRKVSGVRPETNPPSAPACPVATRLCVTCHMPKYSLPGAHFKFTDHRIRVVHSKEPYPG